MANFKVGVWCRPVQRMLGVLNLLIIFFYLAFGFCEYVDPETGLRAIRLLHDLSFGDKNLVVSCAIV